MLLMGVNQSFAHFCWILLWIQMKLTDHWPSRPSRIEVESLQKWRLMMHNNESTYSTAKDSTFTKTWIMMLNTFNGNCIEIVWIFHSWFNSSFLIEFVLNFLCFHLSNASLPLVLNAFFFWRRAGSHFPFIFLLSFHFSRQATTFFYFASFTSFWFSCSVIRPRWVQSCTFLLGFLNNFLQIRLLVISDRLEVLT